MHNPFVDFSSFYQKLLHGNLQGAADLCVGKKYLTVQFGNPAQSRTIPDHILKRLLQIVSDSSGIVTLEFHNIHSLDPNILRLFLFRSTIHYIRFEHGCGLNLPLGGNKELAAMLTEIVINNRSLMEIHPNGAFTLQASTRNALQANIDRYFVKKRQPLRDPNLVTLHCAGCAMHDAKQQPSQIIQFSLRKRVGRGGYGEVFLGTCGSDRKPVAIKRVDAKCIATAREETRAITTQGSQHSVEVYHIVRPMGLYACLVMPLYHGSVDDLDFSNWSWQSVIPIFWQMALAIAELHQHNIIHRDIKGPNFLVLLDKQGNVTKVVVTDFGLARDEESMQQASHVSFRAGTYAFLAPELYQRGNQATYQSDMYSLGKTFFYLLFLMWNRRYPTNPFQAPRDLKRDDFPPYVPLPLIVWVLALTDRNPAQRPSAVECAEYLRFLINLENLVVAVGPAEPTSNPKEMDGPAVQLPEHQLEVSPPESPTSSDASSLPSNLTPKKHGGLTLMELAESLLLQGEQKAIPESQQVSLTPPAGSGSNTSSPVIFTPETQESITKAAMSDVKKESPVAQALEKGLILFFGSLHEKQPIRPPGQWGILPGDSNCACSVDTNADSSSSPSPHSSDFC